MSTLNIGALAISSPATIDRVVRQHGNYVFQLAFQMTGNDADAEDVMQIVFMKLFRNWVNISGFSNLKGWLAKVATNSAIDLLRKRKHHRRNVDPQFVEEEISEAMPPEEKLEKEELDQKLKEGLDKLSPQQLAAFILYDKEGFKGKEVARIMKVSETTVRRYVFEARRKMKEHLKPFLKGREK